MQRVAASSSYPADAGTCSGSDRNALSTCNRRRRPVTLIDTPDRRGPPWRWLLLATAVLVVVAYVASPMATLASLRSAARAGDRDRLEQLVDFPAVRTGLKAQLAANIAAEMQADPELRDNPFAALGAALVPVIIDRVVDTYATPEAIATMVETAKGPSTPNADADPIVEQAVSGSSATAGHDLQAHYSYVGLNRFRARLENSTTPGQSITLVLERRGVFRWQLIRIDLELPKAGSPQAPQTATALPEPVATPLAEEAVQGPEADTLEKAGDCASTTVAELSSRLEGVPDSGSAISYANGKFQVSYDMVPGIQTSRVGDPVTLCVVSVPEGCPPGDDRGVIYRAVNARTGAAWEEADSSHMCGGA